jgi:hypothetical protein
MGKQLINFLTYNLQSRVQTYAVLVKGLYELFGNPLPSSLSHPDPSKRLGAA